MVGKFQFLEIWRPELQVFISLGRMKLNSFNLFSSYFCPLIYFSARVGSYRNFVLFLLLNYLFIQLLTCNTRRYELTTMPNILYKNFLIDPTRSMQSWRTFLENSKPSTWISIHLQNVYRWKNNITNILNRHHIVSSFSHVKNKTPYTILTGYHQMCSEIRYVFKDK